MRVTSCATARYACWGAGPVDDGYRLNPVGIGTRGGANGPQHEERNDTDFRHEQR